MNNLVEYYSNNYRRIVRGVLTDIKVSQRLHREDSINDALAYFDRRGDLDLLARKFKSRYARQIKSEGGTDINTGVSYVTHQTYTKDDVVNAIDSDQYEMFCTGVGVQIVKTLASITSQSDQYFEYLKSSDKDKVDSENLEDVAELINIIRTNGEFRRAMEATDFCSVVCDEAYLHCYYKGWQLRYDVVSPADIWIYYGEEVVEYHPDGGERKITRAVDYSDLDDASVVVIRLARQNAQGDGMAKDSEQYLAYVGECDEYPLGRMVTYWKGAGLSDQVWPPPADKGGNEDRRYVYDYTRDEYDAGGRITSSVACNPLTWLKKADSTSAKCVKSEYPVIKWVGCNGTVNKTSTISELSLFATAVEIDLAASNCVRYAMTGARGKDVLEFGGKAVKLPTSLDTIVMEDGTYRTDGRSASESVAASEVVKWVVATVAAGYNVPDYQVLRATVLPESGVALAIKTKPLLDHLARRVTLNEGAMAKLFDTERALLIATDGGDAESLLTPDITQLWHPGTWAMPEDEGIRIDSLIKLRQAEGIDHIAFLARVHHITEAQATLLHEKYEGRADVGGYGTTPAPPPGMEQVEDEEEAPVDEADKELDEDIPFPTTNRKKKEMP
ncbi:MAG: hypothetical protein WC455_18425 [Dehalococcoidia bacterium]|jgi:hypothetical protein